MAYVVLGSLRLWRGRLAEAEEWLALAARAARSDTEPATVLMVHSERGRLELVRGRHDAALAAEAGARWRIQALILEAIARDALGDAGATSRALEEALELAEPEGLVLPFLLFPAPALRVLRYLPTNLRAPGIAAELFVSVNTIRTHMRHIYAKLGAHQRGEAVARARALGLLAP